MAWLTTYLCAQPGDAHGVGTDHRWVDGEEKVLFGEGFSGQPLLV